MDTISETTVPKKNVILAMFLVTFAILSWSGNIFVSKVTAQSIPPFLLNCLRWIGAGLILTPFAIKPIIKDWAVIQKNWLILSFFSFLAVSIFNALLYLSAHTTSAINIAVISTLTPLCTFIVAWLLYRNSPTKVQILGFGLGIIGVLILIFKGQVMRLLEFQFTIGDIWMFLAVVAWAFYAVTLPVKKPKISQVSFLYCTIVLGVIIALPAVWLEYQSGARWQLSPTDKWSLLYLSLIPSLLSYLFYNYGLSILGAIKTAMFSYLMPVFTAILSMIWLGETIASYHVIGQLLVMAGFYFSVVK